MIHCCLSLCHIPWWTRLVHQEHHHYQKDWRSIHSSFNWTWEWVYDWFLIDCCLSLYRIPWITVLVIQKHHHYQKHWRSIHLSLNWTWNWVYDLSDDSLLFAIVSHSMDNEIGSSGASSLSEALKVNSSLTQLSLYWVYCWVMIHCLSLYHIP